MSLRELKVGKLYAARNGSVWKVTEREGLGMFWCQLIKAADGDKPFSGWWRERGAKFPCELPHHSENPYSFVREIRE